MADDKRVAIIGGGIGGLSAAHYLQGRQSKDGHRYTCEVFEKSGRIGGNGLSAYFQKPFQKPFADLGVNDFNLTAYVCMGEMLREMDAAGFPVPTAPLLDTDCFFTFPGQPGPEVVFTNQDLENPTKDYLKNIKAGIDKLNQLAPYIMSDSKYAWMTVDKFLSSEGFPDDFGTWYFRPRINGMYFMGAATPGEMPIRGVMNYYTLQEGIGIKEPPDRRYFVNGCSDWFRQVQAFLESRGAVIHLNSKAAVTAGASVLPRVSVNGGPEQTWDAVILSVPANQVAAVVRAGLPVAAAELVRAFAYYPATAFAHNFPGVMPASSADWRTYNIRIFPDSKPQPYTISYVETMHQGTDAAKPPFVSENPPVPIPDKEICQMVDLVTGKMVPATTSFNHNTVTFETIAAQASLPVLQGVHGLWYTSGWTNGAGLHEQILVQASEVAEKILGNRRVDEPYQTYSDRHPEHVPEYLRKLLGI